MNVQFFNPPVSYYGDMHFRMLPTLGLPILGTVLNEAGHHTETVDLEALNITPPKLQAAFEAQRGSWPDVVGFTGLYIAAKGIQDSICALRQAGYTGKIVVGGPLATLRPEAALSWGADLVVTGECEGNIVTLLESATGIHPGKPLPIDAIPSPDWDHFRPMITSYYGNMAMLRPNPGISMWTRGCPYRCIFCSNNVFGHQPTRHRPPEAIAAEMADLKKRGVRNVYVYDDELFGTKMPPGWMNEISFRLQLMGAVLPWVTQGRCSKKYVTPDVMRQAQTAGCKAVFWGVESFSPKVLKALNKRLYPEDIWHTLRTAREAGIENGIFTMIGSYQETEEDLALTYRELKRAYNEGLIQYRQTTICTIMEGTQLEEIAKTEGWYLEPPNHGRDLLRPVDTPWLTGERMEYWQAKFNEACPVGIPG